MCFKNKTLKTLMGLLHRIEPLTFYNKSLDAE